MQGGYRRYKNYEFEVKWKVADVRQDLQPQHNDTRFVNFGINSTQPKKNTTLVLFNR
jgi:hypothetical protein